MGRSGRRGDHLPRAKRRQVKLRGFRIELGDIESAITEESGCECLVRVHVGANENRTLVAYVVTNEALDSTSLKKHYRADYRVT